MEIEEKIKDCKYSLKQINHFNPDPYYVDYFLKQYLQSLIKVYEGIFEEADNNFGLFISGKITKEKFESKIKEREDNLGLKFLSWFEQRYKDEHDNPYPNFMKNVLDFFVKNGDLPKIIIKLLPNQRYKDDFAQKIKVELTNGKIRSKESLKIEIKRQTPIFLKSINQKRKKNNEPKVFEKQIIASSFLEYQSYEEVEIPYACEVYLNVVKRLFEESRKEIKKLIMCVD